MNRLIGLRMITGIESCILALLMVSCPQGGANDSDYKKGGVAVWEIQQHLSRKNTGNDIVDDGKGVLNGGADHKEILNTTEFTDTPVTMECVSKNGYNDVTGKNYACAAKDSGKAGDLIGTWRHRESRNIRGGIVRWI